MMLTDRTNANRLVKLQQIIQMFVQYTYAEMSCNLNTFIYQSSKPIKGSKKSTSLFRSANQYSLPVPDHVSMVFGARAGLCVLQEGSAAVEDCRSLHHPAHAPTGTASATQIINNAGEYPCKGLL